MRKALLVLLCMVLALTALVACGHAHTFEEDWSTDAENHWHDATCEHTEEKDSLGAHVDDDDDFVCDTCDYVLHEHTYAQFLSNDATGHWYASTCEHEGLKKNFEEHTDPARDGECDVCGFEGLHTHTWNTAAWQYDGTQHWNPAICGSDCPDTVSELKGNVANHVDENEDGVCDVCPYDGMHRHTFDETEWVSDASGHWYAPTCEHDTKKGSFSAHVDEEGDDFVCDVCNFVIHTHTYDEENWVSADGKHWHAADCGHNVVNDKAACADGDGDNACDVCGAHVHSIDTEAGWEKDETGHWHSTTCSHDPAIKVDFAAHADGDGDMLCDECGFHAHIWDTEWSKNETEHWHAATCPGHEEAKKDVADHADGDGDMLCDECGASTNGPIAGVNKVTSIANGVEAAASKTATITGDDGKSYVLAVAIDKYAKYDTTTETLRIYTKTYITGITENSVAVDSFVKGGVTYEVGSVVPKSMHDTFGQEMTPKVSATNAGVSPSTVAFQFRANITINGTSDSTYYNQVVVNEGVAGSFSFGIAGGKVYVSVNTGWLDTGAVVGEEFAFAVRTDMITAGGKTSFVTAIYVNGTKVASKTNTTCPASLTFKTFSATRDVEYLMTDIYCDSYGIRYEGSCETTTTTVWEKDGAYTTTEPTDATGYNKYDIEWFKAGALTTDETTGVVTSQDKRVAIKSIKDAEGNETTITWSGKTYKAGECYIPKGWLDLGTTFWGSAPQAGFTATEAAKTGTLLYAFESTITVNDYGVYSGLSGNFLEMRLYSGSADKETIYFFWDGGGSKYLDLNWNGKYTYSSPFPSASRGKIGQAMTVKVEIHESATAGQVDIKLFCNGVEFTSKTVAAFDLTKIAFDAPSGARYQTTVFENTTFTKYVTATPAE